MYIIEIPDLEYADNFDKYLSKAEDYLKEGISPTHFTYKLDYKGNVISKCIEFRKRQRNMSNYIMMYADDLKKDSGTYFKIGDIVTLKEKQGDDEYYSGMANLRYEKDKLLIVRWLPERIDNSPYFKNTYAVISNYDDGLFTYGVRESEIQKYEGSIADDSPIAFLQKIIKNEIAVSKETWTNLKVGKVLLDDKGSYKNLTEFKEGDTWSFFSNTLPKKDTHLTADIIISYGMFYTSIKDFLPKARIHATNNYEEDFYVSIEKNPKVIIGKSTLAESELQSIYNYISNNLDVLLEYWNSNGEMDIRDLYSKLKLE